jgi:hypothetical protein
LVLFFKKERLFVKRSKNFHSIDVFGESLSRRWWPAGGGTGVKVKPA